MTFLVPDDGSALSKAALTRARVYAVALENAPACVRQAALRDHPVEVIAMSVVPDSARYAREKGWIEPDEPFDARTVVERLHAAVLEIDPGAEFTHERVGDGAMAGTISGRLRRRAEREDVSVVFVGSENAGRIITPITSVAGAVAADQGYDVHIVRQRLPPETREGLRSEFFPLDEPRTDAIINTRRTFNNVSRIGLGLVGPAALVVLSVVGYGYGVAPKVLGIAWVAFLAMALAIPLGRRAGRRQHARRLVWGYGLASGAMVTSAAVFLVPGAIGHHPAFGGFGLALGVVAGYSAHTVGHRLTHIDAPFEDTSLRLAAHALAAGSIIGIVYAAMPSLGPLLGLAIVSHKGPAGYAAAHRLSRDGRSVWPLLIPAAGVGITAIPTALLDVPAAPVVNALVFGFASGIFLHLAMDFLPRCEVGGEIYEVATVEAPADHGLLDRLRLHAVSSTGVGGVAVFLAWLVV